jgi:hypothetical protein
MWIVVVDAQLERKSLLGSIKASACAVALAAVRKLPK